MHRVSCSTHFFACLIELHGFEACILEQLLQGQCGTACDDDFGLVGDDDIGAINAQALLEHFDQHRVERERTTLEDDGWDDVHALGEAAERLLGDGVER